MSQDYAQEISGHLDQNWRCDSVFCDFTYYNNISIRITFNSNVEGLSPPQELEGGAG